MQENKKKLLFLVNIDYAFVSHRLPIALKAIEEGYEVHLACFITDKLAELESYGIKVHPVSLVRGKLSMLQEIRSIAEIFVVYRKIKPDLVHAVTIKPVLYGGLVARVLKVPAFVAAISGLGYVYSADSIRARLIKAMTSLMYRLSLKQSNIAVIVQNDSDRERVESLVKLGDSSYTLIPGSGADLEHYRFEPEPGGKVKVVMASRLLREKGVYDYVEAAKLLHKDGLDVEIQLVGAPDLGNPHTLHQHEIDQWHEQGVIQALGQRDDIAEIFKRSHIVVLPSYYGEGLPKVLIEAAACGRPIVTTDCPGCNDAVIHEQTGLIVPPQSPEQLAEAIRRLLQDQSCRQEMGEKARQLAYAKFDIRQVVAQHMQIYSSQVSQA